MKRIAAALAASLLALAAHAESPADFAYRLPLAIAAGGAFYRVDVPPAVYEGTLRFDLGDVRVFNGDGAPMPLAFLAPPPAAREAVAAVELPLFPLRVERDRRDFGDVTLNVRRDAAGTTIDLATRDGASIRGERLAGYLIDASELKSPPTALKLTLPEGTNASTRVSVEGSDDLATWRALNASAPVLAAEFGGRRLSLDRVDLAPGPTKFLRIATGAGQPPLEIAGVSAMFADRLIDPSRQTRRVEGVAGNDGAGEYVFDLGGAFPVDRIAVELPEQNTVAPAQIYARNDAKEAWRPVAVTVFYRLKHQDADETTSPPLPVAAVPARHWKIVVDPRAGGLGSKPPALIALWMPQGLVFAARGNGPFELAYGSAQAKPVALPIATLVPGFDARATPATFGVATPGASTVPPALAALRQPVDVKRWLLWSALGLATLVLGWMAYALAKQMRLPVDGEREPPRAGATKETAP